MDRVLLIGSSAAGKSTIARELGQLLGLQVIHLDKVLWQPGCRLTEPDQEPGVVAELLDHPRWVIDGNNPRKLFSARAAPTSGTPPYRTDTPKSLA